MSPMSHSHIPYELLRLTFNHLDNDKPSLCALSLCSSAFCQEARIILFRDVTTLGREPALLKFLRSVTKSPGHLALLVRTFRIAGVGISNELWTMICDGLKAMNNIKRLSIHIGWFLFKNPEIPASMLRGCTFQLERFEWRSSDVEAKEILDSFLPLQDSIKHLSMRISGQSLKYEGPPVCSQLSSLEGTLDVVYAILPDRKFETLTIFGFFSPEIARDPDMISLGPALQCIKALSFHFTESRHHNPAPILRHFRSLQVLEYCDWSLFTDRALSMLPKVPWLHTLIISEFDWFDDPTEKLQQFIGDIFNNCSVNLERIDLQVSQDTYLRYTLSLGIIVAEKRVSRLEVRKPWLLE